MPDHQTTRSPRLRRRMMAAVFTLALSACGGGIDTFVITETSTATIAKGSILEDLIGNIAFGDDFTKMDITSNQTLRNQGVKRSQIDAVHLRSLKLAITDTSAGQDFDFLSAIEFRVGSEGQQEQTLASKDPIGKDLTAFACDVAALDLAPYVAAPSMAVTTNAKGKRPSADTTIRATLELEVDVNVSGILD